MTKRPRLTAVLDRKYWAHKESKVKMASFCLSVKITNYLSKKIRISRRGKSMWATLHVDFVTTSLCRVDFTSQQRDYFSTQGSTLQTYSLARRSSKFLVQTSRKSKRNTMRLFLTIQYLSQQSTVKFFSRLWFLETRLMTWFVRPSISTWMKKCLFLMKWLKGLKISKLQKIFMSALNNRMICLKFKLKKGRKKSTKCWKLTRNLMKGPNR